MCWPLSYAGINEVVENIGSQLASVFNSGNGRRLNKADGALIADAKGFLADAFNLIKDVTTKAGDKMRYTFDEIKSSDRILTDIMGDYLPHDYKDIFDGSVIEKLQAAGSLDEAYEVLEEASTDYCTGPEYEESVKEPTTCEGPKVELSFKPKTCTIDSKTHTIDCVPAKLVLSKTPGSCTFKHHTPYKWTGKECKIEKTFGKEDVVTKGGDEYWLYLDKDGVAKH